jgi:hypothetical protein
VAIVSSALQRALLGSIAGAAGTVALNITTYLDMTVRGRPSSGVPAQVAGSLAESVGVDLGSDQVGAARRSGLGALLGYASGLGFGITYGILRPSTRSIPGALAGMATGLGMMVATDLPAVATGATDLRSWGVSGWVGDLLPHIVYGLATAAVFESLEGGCR